MLTIRGGGGGGFCDGVSRREFLKIGGLALGGMSLPQILQAESRAGIRNNHKAIIMIFLPGGPAHQDFFDLKPDAPSDIRGEFKPIKTNVPGIEITEHMPKMAKMMDKFAVIRSLVGSRDEHASNICNSGFLLAESGNLKPPCLGSVISKVQGQVDKSVPAFVGLAPKMGHTPWADPGDPGFLGLAHAPLKPDGPLLQDMVLNGISLDRLRDRRALLASFDRYRKKVDSLNGIDALNARAFDLLTSSKLVTALDVTKEDPKVREWYGKGTNVNVDDGGPCWNDQFLIARRLVEAGVRCVTLAYGRWDHHGNNFGQLKRDQPKLDTALAALVQDLHNRGLDKDVTVIVWGEFGRTPKINKDGGRDHWPQVSQCLLAGGGMKLGQVIGSTTKDGAEADDRPIHYKEVMATLYNRIGIDLKSTAITDTTGRPNYLLAEHDPVPELI